MLAEDSSTGDMHGVVADPLEGGHFRDYRGLLVGDWTPSSAPQ